MFEISFVSEDLFDGDEGRLTGLITDRMDELVKIANKLRIAGWPIEWTITGLAFDLPDSIKRGPKEQRTSAAIREQLAALGVHHDFRSRHSRSFLDIMKAKVEYRDRVEYSEDDHSIRDYHDCDGLSWDSQEALLETLQNMHETEQRYARKDLIVEGVYPRGVLKGRHQAFIWLFGEEWPTLDDPCDYEYVEIDYQRKVNRTDRVIDSICELLSEKPADSAAASELPDPVPATQSHALHENDCSSQAPAPA